MKDSNKTLKFYGGKINLDLFDDCEVNNEVVDLRDVAFLLADKPQKREARVRMLCVKFNLGGSI